MVAAPQMTIPYTPIDLESPRGSEISREITTPSDKMVQPQAMPMFKRRVATLILIAGLGLAGSGQSRADTGWTVTAKPVFSGQYAAVGDPSVIRANGRYLMFHHCLDVERDPQGGEVCLVQSTDGQSWSHAKTANASRLVKGRLLRARIGGWDEAHETPFARQQGDAIWLYVLGYQGSGFFINPASSGIGLVKSRNPLAFPDMPPPVLLPSVAADQGGITSPSVVQTPSGAVLSYTGWSCSLAEPDCQQGKTRLQLSLIGVALDRAGKPRGKPRVIVGDPGLAWTNGGTSEAEIITGPDGRFYLFFSSLSGPAGQPFARQRIGIAVAETALGPYSFAPDPILSPGDVAGTWANGGVLAPSVLIENGRVRLWFTGFELDAAGGIGSARIGYAEHPWPIWSD